MFNTPEWLFSILKLIAILFVFIMFSNLVYFTVLSLFGLAKPKRDYQIVPDQKRFLFLVPAHNEEDVIKETVVSLVNQQYDNSLYDIVVIADNCTDNTTEIVKSFATVETFISTSKPDEPRGKPHAIANYIATNEWKKYDYIAFIDADNIVDENYLKEMNSQLIARPGFTAIQGYLGMKNVTSSMTASGYAGVYFITNRAVQYANYLLGWNAAIGGTGFVLAADYIEKNGWNPRSYTEDFELQVELSIQGKKSGWNHFAKVYDEKPNSFLASYHQRTRWAQGHWFVGITTTPKQIVSIFKSSSLREVLSKIETLVYSYSMIRPVAFVLIVLMGCIDKRVFNYLPNLFSLAVFWLDIEMLNFIVIPFVYFTQEASLYFEMYPSSFQKFIFYFRLVIAFIWNSITYIPSQLVGFCTWFKPQNNWRKTTHNASYEKIKGGKHSEKK